MEITFEPVPERGPVSNYDIVRRMDAYEAGKRRASYVLNMEPERRLGLYLEDIHYLNTRARARVYFALVTNLNLTTARGRGSEA